MGLAAAAAIAAVGSVAAAGIGAAGSAKAGKDAKSAAASAASQYKSAAAQGTAIISDAGERATKLLDQYRKKLSDPGKLQENSVRTNLDNFWLIDKLAKRTNTSNQSELDRLLGTALPGVKDAVQLAQNNTLSMLRGELPADVAASVTRGAAERSKAGGFAGSENAGALNVRDLGLTSLDMMREGSNSAQRWIQTARQFLMPQLFDPTSMFITPQFEASVLTNAAGVAAQEANIIFGTGTKTADMLVGGQNNATQAALAGSAAEIKANQAMYQSVAQGIQGVAGAASGYFAGAGGATGARPQTFGGATNAGTGQAPIYL